MHVQWDKGGGADYLLLMGEVVTLRSTIPSPPGSRIDGALSSEPTVKVRVKVHSSKKQTDGTFVLTGRPIDLTNAVRAKIEELMSPHT
jgi:hypothetical protein